MHYTTLFDSTFITKPCHSPKHNIMLLDIINSAKINMK